MSNNTMKTTDEYTFVVYNKNGRMDVIDGTVRNVVYSNSGYKIALKMYGTEYTSSYRSEVLWDFGDGTTKKGKVVEHNYTKPGHYTISATLFDENKESCKVSNTVNVIVKELLPTVIKFDDSNTEIKCSKIEKIARLECMVSNLTDAPLEVKVKRIYQKLNLGQEGEESRGKSYFDVKNKLNFHIDKYWTTLKNTQELYHNCDQVYSSDLIPSEVFSPTYTAIYYRLVKTINNTLGLKFYQVLPYKNIDSHLTTITVLDPNADITGGETYKTYRVENVYTVENLPEDAVYCGLRGFVDIFYKSDFLGEANTFSIFYDYDAGDITREMYSGGNYMNVLPLGLTINTISNDITASNLKYVASGNYFANDKISDIKISDTSTSVYIDPYFEGSLYNGLDVNCYVFPVFHYTDEDDIKQEDNSYYIPKDFLTSITEIENVTEGNGKYGQPSVVKKQENNKDWSNVLPWICKVSVSLNNFIDAKITACVRSIDNYSESKEQLIRICQKPLRSIKELTIPGEKVTKVNVNELLDTYMAHPMFLDTPNTRDFLQLFITSFVDKVQTESDNFLDNIANVKTCYLTHLISQLKMMGEEVVEYEHSHLEGINDLKKFSRLLSMNHSDLIGHLSKSEWDIEVTNESKGENVGRKVNITDKITLCVPTGPTLPEEKDNEQVMNEYYDALANYYATFAKVTHINGEPVDNTDIIIREKHSNKTVIVNFRDCLNKKLASKQRNVVDKCEITLEEYNETWGWDLLLTKGYTAICDKIARYKKTLQEYKDLLEVTFIDYERDNINQKIQRYEEEIAILEKRRRDAITGYYDFYLVKDTRQTVRQGNFIAEEYLTDEIIDASQWERQWGITHDILMKILLTNAKLVERTDILPDRGYHYTDIWETSVINLNRNLNIIKKSHYGEGNTIDSVKEYESINFDGDTIDVCIGGDGGYQISNNKYKTSGNVKVHGKIFAEGKNELQISLENCLIDGKDEFNTVEEYKIPVYVDGRTIIDENGNDSVIKTVKIGDSIKGETNKIDGDLSKILIKISGDIDNPTIQVNTLIVYDPSIIKGEFIETFTIEGGSSTESTDTHKYVSSKVYTLDGVDEEFNKDIPFDFTVIVETNIYGEGQSRGAISLNPINFVDGKTDAIYFRDYDKVFLDFEVNNDGEIINSKGKTDETNYISTGRIYLKGKFENIYPEENFEGVYSLGDDTWIEVRLWGSQKGAQWRLTCGTGDEENVFKFYYDYKALESGYDFDSSNIIEDENEFAVNLYTTGDIIGGTKNDDGTYSLPAHISDINIKLTRISEGVYRLAMTGQYTTDVAYYEGNTTDVWQTIKPINVVTDIMIDKFGNICSYSTGEGDEVVKNYNTEFYAFEQGETLDLINEKTFNIKFNISGNVINDNKLTLNRTYYDDKTPTGVFVKLFNNVKVPDDFDFSCLDEHDLSVDFSFINNNGSDFEKIVTKSGDYVAEPRLKLTFSKGEDVHFEYFTEAIKDCIVRVSPTGETELVSRNRVKVKNNINPIIHTFERENIIHPALASTYYDISDGTVGNDKFEIGKDFVLKVFSLTLVTKKLEVYNEYTEQLWSDTINGELNDNKYQAECDVTISGYSYEPDDNGEVLHTFISITPKVQIELENKVLIWYLKKDNETIQTECNIIKTGGSKLISGFSFDQTYIYRDGDEIGEDEDGDVNYKVRVYIPELITSVVGGKTVLKAKNPIVELEIVERRIKKTFPELNWSSSDDVSGSFDLVLDGEVSADNTETLLTVSLNNPSLTIHGLPIPTDNIILSVKENEDDLNKIYLDSNIQGKGTVVINGSYTYDGQFCSIEKEIPINVDGNDISYTDIDGIVTYVDNRYDVNTKCINFNDYNSVLSGGIALSGDGIKDETFNGSINIVSPRLYGVLFTPSTVKVDDVVYTLTQDTTNDNGHTWYLSNSDITVESTDSTGKNHEIAKPTNVEFDFSNGNMSLKESFNFFRNVNEDDNVGDTKDTFNININDFEKNEVLSFPSFVSLTNVNYNIADVTMYDVYRLVQSDNTYTNTTYGIDAELGCASSIWGDTIFDDYYGFLATSAKFGELKINDIPINVNDRIFNAMYDNNGEITQTSYIITFTDDSKQYNFQAQLNVNGNVTVDDDVTYSLDNQTLRIIPKNIEKSAQSSDITNTQNNVHTISTEATFESTMQFYGALAKDSYVALGLGVSEKAQINGFAIDAENDYSQIVSVDKDGNITPFSNEFNITDKLGVVSIRGLATIGGNILGDVAYDISNLTVHADEIVTDSRVIKPQSLNGEVITSNFTVSSVNDGGSYPTNGRIGTNPKVNITNENSILVNGITLTSNDSSFDTNPQWNVTISADGVVSTDGSVGYTFRSIGDAIVLKATFSITGDYADDKILHADTTIDFNDGTTTIFKKVQHEDITVTPGNNLTLENVWLELGKYVEFTLNCSATVNGIILNLTNSSTTVKMTGYDVDDSHVRYEKKVGDTVIASLDYTLQVDGELTYNGTKFEGLKGTLIDEQRYVLSVPSVSYEFGKTTDEENLTGLFTFTPDKNEFNNSGVTFTLNNSVKYDETTLELKTPISFGVGTNFNNALYDGSFIGIEQQFELSDVNETINVIGTVSLSGNVITGMTVGVTIISIDVKGDYEDFALYSNDGVYSMARLKKLSNGDNLFRKQTIESFGATMPNITSAQNMFNGCSNLTRFASNMYELTDGSNMFNGCSSLTTFSGMMPNLKKATNMFKGCALNKQSVKNIINQLHNGYGISENDVEIITIGLDKNEYENDYDFFEYLKANENITSASGQKWKLNINLN